MSQWPHNRIVDPSILLLWVRGLRCVFGQTKTAIFEKYISVRTSRFILVPQPGAPRMCKTVYKDKVSHLCIEKHLSDLTPESRLV